MKILILNWRDPKNPLAGGAEIVTLEHAKSWVKKGHNVTWFTASFNKSPREEMIDGIRIVRQGNFITVYLFAPLFYFLNKKKFDVVIDEVHGTPFFTPIYVRKPVLVFIHEVAGEIWDHTFPFPINKLGKILENFYLRLYRNHKFWTDSESSVRELIKHGIKKENCIAIPCPSNAKPLVGIPAKDENITFITINRIVKMKGIEEVLVAFSFIVKDIKSAKLLVVGSGEKSYVDFLKNRMRELGISKSVEFMGFVDEKTKIELLKKAHVLLHASVKEGWGLVVIEAASQATPSVVYDVPGLRDSVKDNVTGIVIKENTPLEMARQAVRLIENKNRYRDFQMNSLKWAGSLNWDEAAKQSLKLLTYE